MTISRVCILGGTGFVGRHLVSDLARAGIQTRVLTRRRERHRELLVIPNCEVIEVAVHEPTALEEHFRGCDAVVNLAGILNEYPKDGESFQGVHVEFPQNIINACRSAGVQRLLHVSALHAASDAPSQYLQTKAAGEDAVHAAGGVDLQVTSFRPSVIYGSDDSFFNRFAALLALSPLVFPLACAQSRFAPVFVDDVVLAMRLSLNDRSTFGNRYDLCGPATYTLRELVEYTAKLSDRSPLIWSLGPRLAAIQAQILEKLPGKLLSTDNLLSLSVDSVSGKHGFEPFGIQPSMLEDIVPTYIGRGSRSGQFSTLRATAGREEVL